MIKCCHLLLFVYIMKVSKEICYEYWKVYIGAKYKHTETNYIVEVLKIDKMTKNIYVRNKLLVGGWYVMDGWTHVKKLEEICYETFKIVVLVLTVSLFQV